MRAVPRPLRGGDAGSGGRGGLLGAVAEADIHPEDIIYGELRFQTHDHNEQTYQDITLVNFVKLGNEEN